MNFEVLITFQDRKGTCSINGDEFMTHNYDSFNLSYFIFMKKLYFFAVGIVFGIVMIKSEAASWFRIFEMFYFQSFHMYGIIGSAMKIVRTFINNIVFRNIIVIAWFGRSNDLCSTQTIGFLKSF